MDISESDQNKIVGIFIRSLSIGGAEKQAILLHNYLSNYFNTYLIVFSNSDLNTHQLISKENIIFLSGNTIYKILQFYKFIKINKITHIFNFLPLNNIIGIIVGKITGVKYLYGGIRSEKYKSTIKMILMRFLCNNISSGFISNSYAAFESYNKYGFHKHKLLVIQNAITPAAIVKVSNKKIIILSIGRFTNEKDYFTSIKAFNILLKKRPEFRPQIKYNVIGYGKLEYKIKRAIELSGLDDIIEFNNDGYVGKSYHNSNIFLSTSKFEGMPNVIMEAMNNGLPIVATDAGDTKYLVKNNFNGFLCSVADPEFISEKLISLISDKNLCKKMGENSLKIIEESFRPDKVFFAYKNLINNAE